MTAGARPQRPLDAFMEDLEALEDPELAAEGLSQLSEALPPIAPSAELRARVLSDAAGSGRFERFAASVAKILDVGIEQARAFLDRLDDPSVFSAELPGISFYWVPGGPCVANAVRGFLRVKAGVEFPDHEHLGEETVLVLQGSFYDPARDLTVRAGDIDIMPASSSHAYRIPAEGVDLLMLSVTQVGARVMGQTFLPR